MERIGEWQTDSAGLSCFVYKGDLPYLLKRTTPFGEIRLIESGNGYSDNDRYFTSDQQINYFMLLSEYLRITGAMISCMKLCRHIPFVI